MEKLIFLIIFIALALIPIAQEIQEETIAINVEVPVRVFKGNEFVDNLTIQDFEVYEDGVLQRIEAVYLVKMKDIKKEEKETDKEFAPEVSRHFIFVFEINNYLPKIDEVLDYFFNNVLLPGDSLYIFTPVKSFNIKANALNIMPRREIANKLKGILREDIIKGNADHRSLCKHVEDIVETEGLEDDLKRLMCMDILRQLRDLIYIDQEKLLAFSHSLKQVEGQKHIFFFYQKRLLPMPSFLDDLDRLELKHHSKLFNIETLRRSFADSLISCHFLFITEIPQYMIDISRQISLENLGIDMEDNSAEIYSAFREIAEITGGLTDSSANAAASFKKAVNASENYYLLYYAPKNYKADGKFKTIKVRVKGKNYRITHRAGYIAD